MARDIAHKCRHQIPTPSANQQVVHVEILRSKLRQQNFIQRDCYFAMHLEVFHCHIARHF